MLLLAGRSEIWVGVNSNSVQSVQQHNAQCSGATSRCVLRHGMTGKQMENKGWLVGGGGSDMAAIPNCVVGLLKCDGSNVQLREGLLLAEAAISNCLFGLVISYDSDIEPRSGLTY